MHTQQPNPARSTAVTRWNRHRRILPQEPTQNNLLKAFLRDSLFFKTDLIFQDAQQHLHPAKDIQTHQGSQNPHMQTFPTGLAHLSHQFWSF
eukprot:jgi/Botrbrau1/6989/Bobra.0165s0021.1